MRADLLALTPEAVAALANVGLVKRAMKEIEQGKGPKLVENDDGTVVGTFDDGVVAELPPGKLLRDCRCACPATGVCRHRVAVALAYKSFAQAGAGGGAASAAETPAPAIVAWSPGTIDDAAIARALASRTLEEARALARRGVVVEILRPAVGSPAEVPTARLPSCTVRFLVPHDVVYARCDCAVGQGCAHVAIAIWAFREADARDAARPSLTLELRTGRGDREVGEADAAAAALVLDLVAGGVVNAREALGQRFELAREPLVKAGQVWIATALDDLELALARYRARSARYRAGDVLALCAEIVARGRAARAPDAELPASSVLGRGEALETKLDHLRLVGLGCRFDADDRERSVEILLADPDTGTALVMDKAWTFAAGETVPDAPELARRRFGPSSIAMLAKGQLVTRAARRRANRALSVGTTAQGASSVTPQTGDFALLPPPVRVDRIADLDTFVRSRPPRMLRPRVRAEDVHAVRVGGVDRAVFDPGEQMVAASLRDPEGAAFHVRRGHRRVAPRALDALAAALLGEHGTVTWVVGNVLREGALFVVEPTMVVADRVIVPDVEDVPAGDLPRGRIRFARSAVSERVEAVGRALEEIVQLGVQGLVATHEARLEEAAKALDQLGVASIAERARAVVEAVRRARRSPGREAERAAAQAVIDCAIRVELAREQA